MIDDIIEQERERTGQAGKIGVIKAVREKTGLGLKEAKDAVDDYADRHPGRLGGSQPSTTGKPGCGVIATLAIVVLMLLVAIACCNADTPEGADMDQDYATQWAARELHDLPIAYRNDGFSQFFRVGPITREQLEADEIDPFAGTNVQLLVWGLGPGSVFCFDTKAGQVFGEPLTDEQMAMLRTNDGWVNKNVMGLIEQGNCPLEVAVERAHELGIKLLARLEMQHEYGPIGDDSWMWVGFVGDFNKDHPEYRIPGSPRLDFKHQAVRDFKLTILREAAEKGADGLSLDFVVYPPFFEVADAAVMTQFIRDIRAMLDEVGEQQGRNLELMARVPFESYDTYGLDWKTWMREGLIDYIVPSHLRANSFFDIRIEEFVNLAKETGTEVYPTLWQALGFVTTDQDPSSEKAGKRKYDKPKTEGMYNAQALLFHRAGADGLQLGFATCRYRTRPWMDDLGNIEKLLYADKHYMVDPITIRPGTFETTEADGRHAGSHAYSIRIGDDVAAAQQKAYTVASQIVLNMRPLFEAERVDVYINGQGPVSVSGDTEEAAARRGGDMIDPSKRAHSTFVFDREWWKRGEHTVSVPAEWWKLGNNEIRVTYSTATLPEDNRFSLTWIDILLDYQQLG
jgi:hypothetical protein